MNKEQLIRNIDYIKGQIKCKGLPLHVLADCCIRLQSYEAKLALLENNEPKVANIVLRYKEVEINGEIFLECTSCSADKGNCSCWSC